MHEMQPPVNVEVQVSQHETDVDTADTGVDNNTGNDPNCADTSHGQTAADDTHAPIKTRSSKRAAEAKPPKENTPDKAQLSKRQRRKQKKKNRGPSGTQPDSVTQPGGGNGGSMQDDRISNLNATVPGDALKSDSGGSCPGSVQPSTLEAGSVGVNDVGRGHKGTPHKRGVQIVDDDMNIVDELIMNDMGRLQSTKTGGPRSGTT